MDYELSKDNVSAAIARQLEDAAHETERLHARSAALEGSAIPPGAKTAKRGHPEEVLQKAIIQLADVWYLAWLPAPYTKVGDWLYHIPNGGHRSPAEAGIFKAMGVRSGVSDLFFMVPVERLSGLRYAGLYLEVKVDDNKLTDNQELFFEKAALMGYATSEVRSLFEFQEEITAYLRGAVPWQ